MQHANRQRRRRRERFGSASAATRRRRRQQATLERSTADSTTESLAVLYIRCLWYERCLLVAEELPSGFRRDKRPNKTLLVCHRSKDAPRYNSKDICCSAYSHFSIYICICRIYINVVLRRACAYSRA